MTNWASLVVKVHREKLLREENQKIEQNMQPLIESLEIHLNIGYDDVENISDNMGRRMRPKTKSFCWFSETTRYNKLPTHCTKFTIKISETNEYRQNWWCRIGDRVKIWVEIIARNKTSVHIVSDGKTIVILQNVNYIWFFFSKWSLRHVESLFGFLKMFAFLSWKFLG